MRNMWINITLILYAVHVIARECCGLNFLELPGFQSDIESHKKRPTFPKLKETQGRSHFGGEFKRKSASNDEFNKETPYRGEKRNIEYEPYPNFESEYKSQSNDKNKVDDDRRYYLRFDSTTATTGTTHKPDPYNPDANIKSKISTLVDQSLYHTEQRIKSIQYIKDQNRDRPPYRVGFILNLVKKTRDTMNELFNIAVKHRDEYRVLEQMKIYEMIVHTNVDTTNFVRQLVEIHIQNVNSTKSGVTEKRRVVLL